MIRLLTSLRRLVPVLALGALPLALAGCPDDRGPMEEAGEELDELGEDIGDGVEDVVDDDGPVEEAGEELDEAAEDVGDGVEEAAEDLDDSVE